MNFSFHSDLRRCRENAPTPFLVARSENCDRALRHALVESEINVQRSVQYAQAARNEGQSERDKLSLISEGQQKQVGVLGPESTVKWRQLNFTQASSLAMAWVQSLSLTSASRAHRMLTDPRFTHRTSARWPMTSDSATYLKTGPFDSLGGEKSPPR